MFAFLNPSIGLACVATGLMLASQWRRRREAARIRELRAEVGRLTIIAELQRQIGNANDEPAVLIDSVLAHAQAITGASGGAVEMIDGEEMVYRAASGALAGKVGLRLRVASSLSGRCAREQRTLRCDDALTDPRTDAEVCRRLGIRSMVLVPLHAGPEVVGILKVTSAEPCAFAEPEMKTLELMAGLIGAALARADANEQVLLRKKAEQLADHLQSLAHAIPQIVWTANPDGDLDYYNQNWFDYTGMTLEQTRGWGWKPVLHPDDLQNCVECWTHSYKTGARYEVEYRFKRASDGAYRWHLGRAAPVRDASGAIIKWFGTCTDIDDQKRGQELLRESEERYRSVIAASDALIWTNSAEGEMRGEQRGWAAYTGQSFSEYQGYGWASAVHPDDRAPTVEAWKVSVAARSDFAFEHRVRRHDGEYRSFSIRAVPLLRADGTIREWVGVHTDVHDQKRSAEERVQLLTRERSEAALRETNERLSAANLALQTQAEALRHSEALHRAIARNFPNGAIVLFDRELRYLAVDGKGLAEVGLCRETMEGRLVTEIFQKETCDAIVPQYRAALRGEELITEVPFADRIYECRVHPVRDADGDIFAGMVITQDISHRKQYERQILSALREKEVLLKEVHHRVKNNLQVISSLLNMQARGLPFGPTRDLLRESQNRVRSISLVHEKLYASRDLSSVPMEEYLRELASSVLSASSIDRGKVEVQVEVEKLELGVDQAIPCGLIVNELIANCLKHAFPDGRAGKVQLGLRREADQLLLSVADDGIGLPEGAPVRHGALGMQIVGTLTDQLSGQLKLGPGPGASFLIAFPRSC